MPKFELEYSYTITGYVRRIIEAETEKEAEKKGEFMLVQQRHHIEQEAIEQAAADMEVDDLEFTDIIELKN